MSERQDGAATRLVGLQHLIRGRECGKLIVHAVAAEIFGEIELGGGSGLGADRFVAKLERRLGVERRSDEEPLAVVVGDGRKVQSERGLARHRPGGIAGEDVDRARFQRRKAFDGGERNVFDLAGIVEDGSRDGAAEIDVETAPVALVVGRGEAVQALTDAAGERSALLDRLQRLRGCGLRDASAAAAAIEIAKRLMA